MERIIARGAEANILLSNNQVTKDRIPKSYRLPFLDNKLRKSRTKREAKILEKAAKLIPVPKVIKLDLDSRKIEMEFIDGEKLSESLDSLSNSIDICKEIGTNIAKLHDAGIIHGDLTTSNMILKDKLYFIDFGLGFQSDKAEDKAVDLHLIKQALEAKHFENYQKFFDAILEGYKTSRNYDQVLQRLKKVESRGRYKGQH